VTGGYKDQPQLLLALYPVPKLIIDNKRIDLLKSHNLSSFSATGASPFKIGSAFPSERASGLNNCTGFVELVTAIGSQTYLVGGWAWDEVARSSPPWIVLVRHGTIIGLGKSGLDRPDVVAALPSVGKARVGWQGIATGVSNIGKQDIEAYFPWAGGGYCRLPATRDHEALHRNARTPLLRHNR
jgi:hypothetical protein